MLLIAAALGAAAWALAAGTIALLERLSRPAFGWALALASLLLVPALVGLWAARGDPSAAGAYLAFGSAVAAWAWQEVACAPYRGQRSGGFALTTRARHEVAWVVFVLAVSALTWDGVNLAARATLPALWALHASLRLNRLACERASAEGPLVRPPWFAPGLPPAQLWSAVLPLSITALTMATALVAEAATRGHSGVSWALLAGVLAAGTFVHWSIVVRLPAPVAAGRLLTRLQGWGRSSLEDALAALRSVPPLPPTRAGGAFEE